MIEFSTQIPQTTTPVSGPAASGGAAGGFTRLLASFLDAGDAAAPDTPANAGLPTDRQDLAGVGKPVPAALVDDAKPIDPALIWLPFGLPLPAPVAPPIALPPETGGRVPLAAAVPEPAPLAVMGALFPADGATGAGTDGPVKDLPIPAAALVVKQDAAAPDPLSKAAGTPSQVVAATTTQSAGQTFAAAIAAALANHEHPARDDDRGEGHSLGGLAAAQADTVTRPVVQAASDAKHPALDLREDRGLHGMIDRIEMLRDEANARDTRIRLVPDALGGVDVSLRKDGDTLHVHFTADTQATRALLTDAQPRLAELADARGVKLGQTSVDADAGGGADHAHHQQRAAAPRAPVSVSVPAADAAPTDQRLA